MDGILHSGLPAELGRRISVQIGNKYVNVSALARHTGLSQSYISKVLGGKLNPSRENLRVLASALEMTVGQLVDCIETRYSSSSVA